jgi:subtilisin family serine protease
MLPVRGLRAQQAPATSILFSLHQQPRGKRIMLASSLSEPAGRRRPSPRITVLDSIAETGAKLVEFDAGDEALVREAASGVRLVPEVFYERQSLKESLLASLQQVAGRLRMTVAVTAKGRSSPLRGITVVGFTDFANREGAQAVTDAKGNAVLQLPAGTKTLERLYTLADEDVWSAVRKRVTVAARIAIALDPIDLGTPDALRSLYGEAALSTGAGVTVGVVDTGVGPHGDIVVAGGYNAVRGEDPDEYGDNGDRHGTHVGGIIAGRGLAPTGVRGVAPGVSLFSYRVFPKGEGASNFDIAKAIDRAVQDRCDLINLSLGRPAGPLVDDEPLLRVALEDAREAGVLPIAAAGNDFRQGVGFPASDELCIAVTALGLKSTLPAGTASAQSAAKPFGRNPDEFVADFSNIGREVDVTAPGVGIVSAVPDGHYAVMDGTSMACPAAVGAAARALSRESEVLALPRNLQRSAEIARVLLASARTRGFPPEYEGRGLPLP